MIEINIPTAAAVVLLTQRMRFEQEMREKAGKISQGNGLKDLTYKELLNIAETAAFDISVLLPGDILEVKNNLSQIISKSIQSLSNVYDKNEFKYYSEERAKELLRPINGIFENFDEDLFYSVN